MKRRKIIAATVLLGGVVLFFVIISAPASSGTPFVTAKAGQGGAGSLDYTVNASGSAAAGSGSGQNGTGGGNLTDAMIQNYAQNILQMNNGFSGAAPNATNTVSFPSVDAMASQLSTSLNQTLPSKTFTAADIAAQSDDSTSSQIAYLAAINKLTTKNFAGFSYSLTNIVNQAVSDANPAPLDQYIAIINNEISGLLAIPVPPGFTTWHIQNLDLWEERLAVFTAISNIQTDPLKGYIAINQIGDIIDQNKTLQDTIDQKISNLASRS